MGRVCGSMNKRRLERILNRLCAKLSSAIKIGKRRWYGGGVIFVISNQTIITVYKPCTQHQMNAVYSACALQRQVTPPTKDK